MFKYPVGDYSVWTWLSDKPVSSSLHKKYSNTSPHIIYDDEFEVCLLLGNMSQYGASSGMSYYLVRSFLDEFIWLYQTKEKNVAANLARLLLWLSDHDARGEVKNTRAFLKEKYPQYLEDIEKYMVLV